MSLPPQSRPDYPSAPGIYDLETRGPAGEHVRYTLRIPAGNDGRTALPAILCLHFGGPATAFYGRLFLELIPVPGLGILKALLVAPTTDQGSWTTPGSEAIALTALAEVERHLEVETTRRVVMGYSMGGIGAWHFAARFREQFMAAIPIAGAPRQADLGRLRDLPLYVIHSQEDRIIPITADAEAVLHLQAMGAPVAFAALPGGDHFDYRPVIAALRTTSTWLAGLWARP